MDKRTFYVYSAVGAILWAVGVTSLGALLGQVPFVRANLEAILLSFVLLSAVPIFVEVWRHRRSA
jgi:membrane-associated protein